MRGAPRSTRARAEMALVLLFVAAIIVAGAAALYFVLTISGHSPPASRPSTAAGAPAAPPPPRAARRALPAGCGGGEAPRTHAGREREPAWSLGGRGARWRDRLVRGV